MSAILARASRQGFLVAKPSLNTSEACMSSGRKVNGKKIAVAVFGGVSAVGAIGAGLALLNPVQAQQLLLHPPSYPWNWMTNSWVGNLFATNVAYDKASLRRGFQVYKQVCAACHTMEAMRYRMMVDVFMTEKEVKAEAEEIMVWDGPNDLGKMFQRPGKLADPFPKPYANEEEAKAANNGANPPDLSHITLSREDGVNYVFSLLTGYCDPPAGYELAEGMHYNPYFTGGSINMAQALYNEIIEYDDGTPATQSQLARDVVTFLNWCSDPDREERRHMGTKVIVVCYIFLAAAYYYKRVKWHPLLSQKLFWKQKK